MNKTKKTTKRRELTDEEKLDRARRRYYAAVVNRLNIIASETEEEANEAYQDLLQNGSAFDKVLAYYLDTEAAAQGEPTRYTIDQLNNMIMNLPDEQSTPVRVYERFYQILSIYGSYLSEYCESYRATRAEFGALCKSLKAFYFYTNEISDMLNSEYIAGGAPYLGPMRLTDPNGVGEFSMDFEYKPFRPDSKLDSSISKKLGNAFGEGIINFQAYRAFIQEMVKQMSETYTSPLWWIMPRRTASYLFNSDCSDFDKDFTEPLQELGGQWADLAKRLESDFEGTKQKYLDRFHAIAKNYYNAIVEWRSLSSSDIEMLSKLAKNERTGRQ